MESSIPAIVDIITIIGATISVVYTLVSVIRILWRRFGRAVAEHATVPIIVMAAALLVMAIVTGVLAVQVAATVSAVQAMNQRVADMNVDFEPPEEMLFDEVYEATTAGIVSATLWTMVD